ncbi:MAG: hypothetical protein WC139_12885 [Candidatus Kapaibacterium sp.]
MLDIVSRFQTQATLDNYMLLYGAKAFLNYELSNQDLTEGTVIIGIFPVIDTAISIAQSNRISRFSTSLTIWFGRKFDIDGEGDTTGTLAELDETYKQKYDRRLYAMKLLLISFVEAVVCGSELELTSFRMTDAINQTDENIDFISCDIIIQHDIDY